MLGPGPDRGVGWDFDGVMEQRGDEEGQRQHAEQQCQPGPESPAGMGDDGVLDRAHDQDVDEIKGKRPLAEPDQSGSREPPSEGVARAPVTLLRAEGADERDETGRVGRATAYG